MLIDHELQCTAWGHEQKRIRDRTQNEGEFIRDLADWSWFGTITSRYGKISEKAAKKFLAEIEAAAGYPVHSVLSIEHGDSGGHLHGHFLISSVGHLDMAAWQRRANARFGNSVFRTYDKDQGAAFYIAQTGCSRTGRITYDGKA